MPKVIWDDTGNRLYHAGIDRGMLYVGTLAVPWNGLISVTEAPSGGDASGFFFDGQKYIGVAGLEEFAASVSSFANPREFAPCAGRQILSNALYAADQPKQSFVFSYRTMIGNDVDGFTHAYKINIVFNCLAKISDFAHGSIATSPGATPYSFDVQTSPVAVTGFKPTSHIVVDTRVVSSADVTAIEKILYGDGSTDPRMPTAAELVTILTS
jgi:hypothetical protein